MVEDCRAQVVGGLISGLHIFKQGLIPFLLANSECWIGIDKKTINELETIQLSFLRSLFAIGSGTPIPLLLWDTGTLMMKYRILKRKLVFFHHLATLPDDCLAREVFDKQVKLSLPGLVPECQPYLETLNITDVSKYSKFQWKKIVNKFILNENRSELLNKIKDYKKLDYYKLDYCVRNNLVFRNMCTL